MKNAVTFSASPSFAALRLLAFDSSSPKLRLGRPLSGSPLLLAPPAPGIYTLQPAKESGQHYFYHLQLRSQAIPGGSSQPEAPYPLSSLHSFSWVGEF